MDEMLLYIQRIHILYGSFSKTEKRLADIILADPNIVLSRTTAELAELSETSAATVVRFCRTLGFSGYQDLRDCAINGYASIEGMDLELTGNEDTQDIKSKVLMFTQAALKQLDYALKADALERAAALIGQAAHVVLVGEGGSGTICNAAQDIFMKAGIPCQYVSDLHFQSMIISTMTKEDVLIMISNSGRSSNSLINVRQAYERGIPVIGIVGLHNAQIAQYLDIELQTNLYQIESFSDLAAARICELTVISIIYTLVHQNATPQQQARSKDIAEALERKRIPLS